MGGFIPNGTCGLTLKGNGFGGGGRFGAGTLGGGTLGGGMLGGGNGVMVVNPLAFVVLLDDPPPNFDTGLGGNGRFGGSVGLVEFNDDCDGFFLAII